MNANKLNISNIKIDEFKNEEVAGLILSGLRAYSAPYLGTDKAQPFSLYMVDTNSKVIAGVLGATRQYLQSKTLWVYKVWVEEAYRGHGLGKQLLTHLNNFAYNKSCTTIQIEVFDFQNKSFFEKLGFQSVGVILNALMNKDKFFMRKIPHLTVAPLNSFPIFLNEAEDENIKQAILNGCNNFNKRYFGDNGIEKDFSIYLQDFNLKIIGGIIGKITSYQAWVHIIWVDELFRGKGIGKILWEKFEEYIRNKGCVPIFVGTLDVFHTTAFYEKLRCKHQGTISKWIDHYDQHFFEKKLIP